MKKIINKLLIASFFTSLFTISSLAYRDSRFEISNQLEITNILKSDDRVFMLDGNLEGVQTYIANEKINIFSIAENVEHFSATKIEAVDSKWTKTEKLDYSYGGIVDSKLVSNSIININEPGLYYISSINNGIEENLVICIETDKILRTNAYLAKNTNQQLLVNDINYDLDIFSVNDNIFIKISDLAKIFVDTDKEFDIKWNTDFNFYDIYTNEKYSQNNDIIKNNFKDSIAFDTNLPDLYKELTSTKIHGYTINNEHFYDLGQIANILDFYIEFNENSIEIDINKEFKPY